jgi:hypothetical protein
MRIGGEGWREVDMGISSRIFLGGSWFGAAPVR